MRTLRAWIVRIADAIRPGRRERELTAELESHFHLHIDDNIRAGMTPDQARRAAIAKFGPVEAIKDGYRDRAGVPALEIVVQDARYGMRRLFRQPGFAVLIIVTLAVGVGANAAMFGLVDRLMFRMPDHVREPQRLLDVPGADNYVRYHELQEKLRSVDLASYTNPQTLSFGAGTSALPLRTQCVSATFLGLLGVSPHAGRFFDSREESIGSERVIVLSHGFWRRQFGGDVGVIGRNVVVGGRSFGVIGVAPDGFAALDAQSVDAWILLTAAPEVCSFTGSNRLRDANGSWLRTIGRLRPDTTLADASGEIAAAEAHRQPMVLKSGRVIETAAKFSLRYPPERALTQDGRLALWLAGAAVVLLLLACTNIAGLLSMRAVDRRREIALRLQLGATRRRLAAQLLVEHLLIAVLGSVVAIAVAAWLGDTFATFFLFDKGPGVLDARMLGLLTALALVSGLLSGTFPALQATRGMVGETLRTGRTTTPAGSRVRTALLVAQVALALVLVVGAGLFVRSVQKFRDDFAYDLDRVVAAAVDFRRSTTSQPADIHAAFERMLERVVQLPQVEAAALSSSAILSSGGSLRIFWIRRNAADEGAGHGLMEITPEYFRTLGLRITTGRAFEPADAASERPVIIINSILAAKLFPGEDPIGKCVIVGSAGCTEIIGVSEPFRATFLHDQADSQVFVPLETSSTSETTPQVLLVRTRSAAAGEVAAIASALQGTSSDLPYVSVQPLTALADRQARSWLLGATAFSLFGGLAVALAAIGIFGALAFTVRQRTIEIGVRMALGADRGDIAGLIFRYGAFVLILGGAFGAAGAFAASRFVRSLLFNVPPGHPPAFVLALGVLALAVLAGCLVPLFRATRIDPALALRYEC